MSIRLIFSQTWTVVAIRGAIMPDDWTNIASATPGFRFRWRLAWPAAVIVNSGGGSWGFITIRVRLLPPAT